MTEQEHKEVWAQIISNKKVIIDCLLLGEEAWTSNAILLLMNEMYFTNEQLYQRIFTDTPLKNA